MTIRHRDYYVGVADYINALILLLLNVILYLLVISVQAYSPIPLSYLVLIIITGIAGFIASKDLGAVISEALSIVFMIAYVEYESFVSVNAVVETLAIVMLMYFMVVILRGGIYKSLHGNVHLSRFTSSFRVRKIREVLMVLIYIIGIISSSLIVSGMLAIFGISIPYTLLTSLSTFSLSIPDYTLLATTVLVLLWSIHKLFRSDLKFLNVMGEAAIIALGSLIFLLSPITYPLSILLNKLSSEYAVRSKGVRFKELGRECVIKLGTILSIPTASGEGLGNNACIEFRRDAPSHTLIIGATGTGKTTLAKGIVNQGLKHGYRIIVIDTHGEYSQVARHKDVIEIHTERTPLNLTLITKYIGLDTLAEIISDTFNLGEVQRYALKRTFEVVVEKYGELKLGKVIDTINEMLMSSEHTSEVDVSRDVIKSLIPYIRSLKSVLGDESPNINYVGNSLIINLSNISGLSTAKLYVEIMLRLIFNDITTKSKDLNTVIVIEELHNYVSKYREGIIGKLLREGRKFGVSIIALTQDIGNISDSLLNNFRYIVIFPIIKPILKSLLVKLGLTNFFPSEKQLERLTNIIREFEPIVIDRFKKAAYHIKTYISD